MEEAIISILKNGVCNITGINVKIDQIYPQINWPTIMTKLEWVILFVEQWGVSVYQ